METLATVKTEANIAVVQNAFENFLKGNIPGILDACTDDITWSSYHNSTVPYAQTYHGKQGAGQFFATLASNVDYTSFQPKEFFADKDRVFVNGYHEAKVKSTGKSFGHDFLMEFRLRDGKVSYFFAGVDTRDQAEAFGSQNLEQLTRDMHNYFSNNQFDKILERAADDITVDAIGLNTVFNGKKGLTDFMSIYKKAFPDLVLEHTNIFSSGNQVTVEFIARGTNTGPLLTPKGEIPATGRSASSKVSEQWIWKDGKVKSIHSYSDTASLLIQLGLL
jgi:ketosteroid isomerase-like protein